MTGNGLAPDGESSAGRLKEALRDRAGLRRRAHAGPRPRARPVRRRSRSETWLLSWAARRAPAPSSQRGVRPCFGRSAIAAVSPRRSTRAWSRKRDFSSRSTNASTNSSFRLFSATARRRTWRTSPEQKHRGPGQRLRPRLSKSSPARWKRARSGLRSRSVPVDRLRPPRDLERRPRTWTARHALRSGALFAADDRGRLRMSHPDPAIASASFPQGARAGSNRAAAPRSPLVAFHGNRGETDSAADDRNPRGNSDEPWRGCSISRGQGPSPPNRRLRRRSGSIAADAACFSASSAKAKGDTVSRSTFRSRRTSNTLSADRFALLQSPCFQRMKTLIR